MSNIPERVRNRSEKQNRDSLRIKCPIPDEKNLANEREVFLEN